MVKKIGEMLPMREGIKQAAIKTFSLSGYECATVRKIAEEANVSPGQINFYFRGKDKLYSEIMDNVSEELTQQVKPIRMNIEALLEKDIIPEQEMWDFFEFYIDMLVNYAFDENNQNVLRLVFNRVDCNEQRDACKLSQTIKEQLEIPFSVVLRKYYQIGYLEARTITRCINGSLFSFIENGDLFLNDVKAGEYMPQALIWLKGYLRKHLFNSLLNINVDK